MRIRPSQLELPTTPLTRRHRPKRTKRRHYAAFRSCLRWEFGFTCGLCLLHETDFVPTGVEGLAVTSIEHVKAQSRSQAKRNAYANCIYACRLCNTARAARPNKDSAGRRLLDPTKDAWAAHFRFDGARLAPIPGDPDAEYTAEAYDLADERKTRLRAWASKFIAGKLKDIASAPDLEASLLALAARQTSRADADRLIDVAQELRARTRRAFEEVCTYRAVPMDAPPRCLCSRRPSRLLSPQLAAQVISLKGPG
jgi:hypothetical protein